MKTDTPRRSGRWGRFLLTAALMVPLAACDDDTIAPDEMETFTVRIENVSTAYAYPASGVFNTPVGATDPAAIGPDGAYEFSFFAPPGSSLSLATMFIPSNDFFYAPAPDGIPLWDGSGNPVSGDVTDQISLWDAGTEVNQEPGEGDDQVQRQAGPDTGADDPDSDVRSAPDTFANLPAVEDVIAVTITPGDGNEFTVRIENVSTATTLSTSTGDMQAVPLSPGAWVVHTDDAPLFNPGEADYGEGLEAIAEDGAPGDLGGALDAMTGLTVPLSPGVFAVHEMADPLFTDGESDRGEGLEAIAEDGDPSSLASALATAADISASGAFNTPVGAGGPGPLLPGDAYEFTFEATEGERLSFATMFIASNDLFYAPTGAGIALFTGGTPTSGNVTSQVLLWDAGTEVNERPGVGDNQVMFQAGPDTGPDENGDVMGVDDGFTYPSTASIIQVTITPGS